MTGKTYGRWSVLSYNYTAKGNRVWKCICECGTIKDVSANSLKTGNSKSCGCYKAEVASATAKKWNQKRINIKKEKTQRCSICNVLETETPRFHYTSPYGNNLCNRHFLQFKKRGRILDKTRLDDTEIRIYDKYAEVVIRDTYGKEIEVAIIDVKSVDLVKQYKWHLSDGYACCKNGDIEISMHRLILGDKKDRVVDHIDGNRLNNIKSNLRHVTTTENSINKSIQSNNKSGICGVYWREDKQRWYAEIMYKNKSKTKTFYDAIDAIKSRLIWEIEMFGEYRRRSNWNNIHKVSYIICIINQSNTQNRFIYDYVKENTDMEIISTYDNINYSQLNNCIVFINENELSNFYTKFGYKVISLYLEDYKMTKDNSKIKKICNYIIKIRNENDYYKISQYINDRKKKLSIFSKAEKVGDIENV